MTIPLSVTIRDHESGAVRTFITEVPGDITREKDRDKALRSLVEVGAPETLSMEVGGETIEWVVIWAPAVIISSCIVES